MAAGSFDVPGGEEVEDGPVGHGELWVQKDINHRLLLNKDIR